MLLCDRRTAPTLFSTLAWYPPVGGTRRIGKDSPVHRPDGLRPSRRRITACDQRFEGYPSMLACYIRRAAGTHEYLYYDSSGQRRAGPQLTGLGTSCALYFSSPPNAIFPGMRRKKERHTAGAPAETMSHGGTAKEVTLCFFSPHPLLCYLFPAHPRALPYPMGTSSDPASLPYYLAAFCITNYSKTALAKRPTTCLTFFEREMGSGASPGVSAKPGWSVWLVVWKTGSAWRRSGRSPSGSGTST